MPDRRGRADRRAVNSLLWGVVADLSHVGRPHLPDPTLLGVILMEWP